MNAIVAKLPPDTGLAALANESAQAWNRAYELEDKRREGEWAKYFAAVAEAEAVDEALALVAAESPIGVRIKYVVAMSRLPERGGRRAGRRTGPALSPLSSATRRR